MSRTKPPQLAGTPEELPQTPASGVYQVGDLCVDIGRCRVTRQEAVVPLTRLSFDLLVALVEVSPNVLTPDLMMERVWPGVVISPETVTQRVKVLRDALGDAPRSPRYIEGVRGRGYRLATAAIPIAADTPSSQASANEIEVVEAVHAASSTGRQIWLWPILIVAAIAGLALLAYRIPEFRSGRQVVVSRKAVTVSAAPPNSIAVLPFENLSAAPNGNLVALGMSEAVLHQLANVHQLMVIARTSSFAFQGRNKDAREIARQLNAHYLLEGSVQSDPVRLRVTAQLVDASTGGHVWSIRLDRSPRDIFAIQDEISQAVAEALQVSLTAQAPAAGSGHRAQSIEAWLAFQQGRALVGTRKIVDLEAARERFAEAMRIDPKFSAAYVGLAEAYVARSYVSQSEFWLTSHSALTRAEKAEVTRLLTRALELDPNNGDAYLIRAWQEDEDVKAEPDYRRGLALSPNNAAGHAHLARLLFRAQGKGLDSFDPAKRTEALELMDRARELDPLAPGHYVLKALMLSYGHGNWRQAIALSLQALERDPNYYPALMKLAEFKWAGSGELAEAARYAEEALALEPQALWPRHMLSRIYLDLHDFGAARSVIEERREPDFAGQVPLEMYRHHWQRVERLITGVNTNIPGDVELLNIGMVRAALTTGELAAAVKELDENDVGLKWTEDGDPKFTLPDYSKESRVLLGRLLIAMGEVERGRRVLRAALREMDHDAFDLGRGESWFDSSRAEALAVLGDSEGAIETLRRGCATAFMFDMWYRLDDEPAYAALRDDPRFAALVKEQNSHIDQERARLGTMRARGLIPARVAPTRQ